MKKRGLIRRIEDNIQKNIRDARKELDKTSDKVLDKVAPVIFSEGSTKKSGKKVKTIMSKPVFIPESATKKQIFAIAKKNPNTKVFIIQSKTKKFLGDIHEDDLFLMLIPNQLYSQLGDFIGYDSQKKFFAKNAKELMRKNDLSCSEDEDILDVALQFTRSEINEMPVLNKKGQVVGVITQGIIARHLEQK